MPRTRSLAWSELKVGVLTIIAIVIVAIAIFLLAGGQGFFWQQYHLTTRFTNAAGLKPGAPVRVAGVEVGSVKDVRLDGASVEVSMAVKRSYQSSITSGSLASLGSVSLLGESAVDITASPEGTPIPDGGSVQAGAPPVALSDVTTRANSGLSQLNAVLSDIRTGKGTLGKMVTDDQLYRNLRGFTAAAADVMHQVQQGHGTIGELLKNPKTAHSLQASLENLQTMTARLNAGEGSLGRLLKDDKFADSLSSTTGNLSALTGGLKDGKGTAGKLLTDAELYNRLNSLSGRLDSVLAGLDGGNGTAGQLLKDRRLYENMNQAVSEVRDLVQDIRKDPKKFLTVRVSVF